MTVKILMTWDILPGRDQEYFEFVVRDFIPSLQELGMTPSDAWFTMYGDQPQIMAAAEMESKDDIKDVLESAPWNELTLRLLDYVENFHYKIVPSRSGFQM